MADTLRGLSYMHGLGSGPIAHGDIKLVSGVYATTCVFLAMTLSRATF
jgi:hypothetical protein